MPDHSPMLYEDDGAIGISLDHLQRRLHHRLETTGVLDRLRAQLRKQILCELRQAGARSSDGQAKQISGTDRAFNVIVADFLSRHDHSYALSVFLSESGTDPDVFKACDLERMLNLPEQIIAANAASKSILASIVELATRLNRPIKSCSVQTERVPDDMLQSSLRLLEQKFKRRSDEEDEATKRSFEERIATQIREVEQRAAETLQQEVERIRTTEIAAVRISESEKYQQELNAIRQSFEKQHQERLQQLRIQEQEQDRQLQKRKQTLESLEYERRQQLLAEIETIRLRDIDLKRGVELERRALQLERESLRKELEDAKLRANVFEKELERKAYAMELNAAEYDSSYSYLQRQEKQQLEYVIKEYNEKRQWLDQEAEAFQKCKMELSEAQSQLQQQSLHLHELNTLKVNLDEARSRVNELHQQLTHVSDLKQSLELKLGELKEENGNLHLKICLLQRQLEDDRKSHEAAIASLEAQHEVALKVFKSESSNQQKVSQNQILSLSKELQDRLNEEERIQSRYEDEQLRCRSLLREISRLQNDVEQLSMRRLEFMQVQSPRFQNSLHRPTETFLKKHIPHIAFDDRPGQPNQDYLNKENFSERSGKIPEPSNHCDKTQGNRNQITPNLIAPRNQDKVQDTSETSTLPPGVTSDKETKFQATDVTGSETVVKEQALSIKPAAELASYLPGTGERLMSGTTEQCESTQFLDSTDSVANPIEELASYLPSSSEHTNCAPQGTQLISVDLQKDEQTGKSQEADTEQHEAALTLPVLTAKPEQSEEDIRRQEASEKRREEMILRAAQQRKERDERERRERLTLRKSSMPSNLNNVTVNRAPPVKRNFSIDDKL